MLIKMTGAELRKTLDGTIERLLTHEGRVQEFLEKHRAAHAKASPGARGECATIVTVRAALAQMTADGFRLRAMREALRVSETYTLSMRNYVVHYATLSYDSMSLPDPEESVSNETLGGRSSLFSSN